MGRSSLGADQQATLPEAREVRTNGDPTLEMRTNKDSAIELRTNVDRVPEESLMDAEQPDNDSDMDDTPTQDGQFRCVCVSVHLSVCLSNSLSSPAVL